MPTQTMPLWFICVKYSTGGAVGRRFGSLLWIGVVNVLPNCRKNNRLTEF